MNVGYAIGRKLGRAIVGLFDSNTRTEVRQNFAIYKRLAKINFLISLVIGVLFICVVCADEISSFFTSSKATNVENKAISQVKNEPKQENIVQTKQQKEQSLQKPEILAQNENSNEVEISSQIPTKSENLTQNQSSNENAAKPEIKTSSENSSSSTTQKSVNFEQKFGKRIYLETKDEFVNLRKAPNGEILTPIYKRDFADILIYSFDTNKNTKWLKVAYFPINAKSENEVILGYIHISQVDKNKF